jgi:hypothetical protein
MGDDKAGTPAPVWLEGTRGKHASDARTTKEVLGSS